MKVQLGKSKEGESQVIFFFDIAEGELKNFYRRQTERFKKNRFLRVYQNTEGKGLPHFKGIIQAIEEGNPPYKFDFNEAGLLHKKIGANLREEEYYRESDGTIGTSMRVAYLCSIRSVQAGEHKVLPVKKLAQKQNKQPGDDGEESQPYDFDQTPVNQDDFPPPSDNDLPY